MRPAFLPSVFLALGFCGLAPLAAAAADKATIAGTVELGGAKAGCADITVSAVGTSGVISKTKAVGDAKSGHCTYSLEVPANTALTISAAPTSGAAITICTERKSQLLCDERPKTQLTCDGQPKPQLVCNGHSKTQLTCNGQPKPGQQYNAVAKARVLLKLGQTERVNLLLQKAP